MSNLRSLSAAAALGLSAVVLTGCGGVYDIPLPGGANIGDHPKTLHIQFEDVTDLVPQAAVKVDGVPVGRVDAIDVAQGGWTADVTVLVNNSVRLPGNAIAAVQQTNLLGEKFIELSPPAQETASGQLADGATIPLSRTRTATDIEQVLGALSLLLNGGGVAQLQPIVTELNKTFGGREPKVRALLEQSKTLIQGLEKQVGDIQAALDGLDVLGARTGKQTEQIGKLLDELPKGIRILDEQRPEIVNMLGQLDRLGQAGQSVLSRSKDNLVADLLALRPTLQELGKAAPDLVTSFPLVLTYPFPDAALESTYGGQMNTWLSVDLSIGTTLHNLGVGQPNPVYIQPVGPRVPVDPANPYYNGNGPRPGWPTVSLLPIAPVAAPAPPPAPNPIAGLLNQLRGGRR
ncbi:MAG: MCE family protein [Mycobacteriaceae bacterium]|nr:MCE family protein [Mycobacteriaceae bacterium]